MDENWRDVLIAGLTVAGALGGIALGSWLERGRRYDEPRRIAYSQVIARGREAESSLRALADTAQRNDPVSADWASGLVEAIATLDIVGSDDVAKRAQEYAAALSAFAKAWLSDRDTEVDRRREETSKKVREARQAFAQAARRDLGMK